MTTLDKPTPTPHVHIPYTTPYCMNGTPIGAHNGALCDLQTYMHKENHEL